ncbi:MAG: META domain-containing protein [Alteraurantiacibacter sp. bin_em_oilr2.035]|nr:META domain-containing protein [Alteraurantiacibacter sp. bin_em_oilr2.035]
MRIINMAAVFVAGMAMSACATYPDDGMDSSANLVGHEWLVEDIAARGVIDDARTTIVFGEDGRVSGDTACNRYFAEYETAGSDLRLDKAGVTKRACAPAVMDQEQRFLDVFNEVESYRIDATGALILSTLEGATIMARRSLEPTMQMTYRCSDGSIVEASYPTTDTALIVHQGRSVQMNIASSASGARYVGGGLQWWTKGANEGMLSPLAEGEDIASARGINCTAR